MKDGKKKAREFAVIVVLLLAWGAIAHGQGGRNLDVYDLAPIEVERYADALAELGSKEANDVEVQLGLLGLYARPGINIGSDRLRAEQVRHVLSLEPDNRAAWSVKVRLECRRHIAQRDSLLSSLERIREHCAENGVAEFKVLAYSELHPWLAPGKDEPYVIDDFSAAQHKLEDSLDVDLQEVLKGLDTAEELDPQNALYPYLRGYLYLSMNEEDKALEEVEKGAAKPILNRYEVEICAATEEVLARVASPQEMTEGIVDVRTMFLDLVYHRDSGENLWGLADYYEDSGDVGRARRVCQAVKRLAQHIRSEPLPYRRDASARQADLIQKKAVERLNRLEPASVKKATWGIAVGALILAFGVAVTFLAARRMRSRANQKAD